jgi:hypothetical protein
VLRTIDGELIQCESVESCEWSVESEIESTLIKGVLLCGTKSRNGYDIPEAAFGDETRIVRLYDNKPVYLNHPSAESMKKQHPAGRPVQELAGVVKNPRKRNGRVYGDIETAGCPQGETLRDLATAKVPGVGLSHVARYKWKKPDKLCVESVEEVMTVDVVTRPATTNSFTEQTGSMEQELIAAKAWITQLESELGTKTQALKDAETRIATLAAEQTKATEKIAQYEAEAARVALVAAVNAEIESAGLDLSNKDICGAVWVESLVSQPDADKRKALIADRVALIGIKAESVQKPVSGVRKPIGKPASADVVTEAMSRVDLLV